MRIVGPWTVHIDAESRINVHEPLLPRDDYVVVDGSNASLMLWGREGVEKLIKAASEALDVYNARAEARASQESETSKEAG